MNLVRSLYQPRQCKIEREYRLVVPHDYGVLANGKLPEATIRCLTEAMRLICEEYARHIAWASTNTFGFSADHIDRMKLDYLKRMGFTRKPLFMTECNNTITEVEDILGEFPDPGSIISVCEWRHARRTQRIWRHFFKGKLAVVTIDSDWKEHHVSGWCKPKWGIPAKHVFLTANLGHHALMTVRGVEALREVNHSAKPGK